MDKVQDSFHFELGRKKVKLNGDAVAAAIRYVEGTKEECYANAFKEAVLLQNPKLKQDEFAKLWKDISEADSKFLRIVAKILGISVSRKHAAAVIVPNDDPMSAAEVLDILRGIFSNALDIPMEEVTAATKTTGCHLVISKQADMAFGKKIGQIPALLTDFKQVAKHVAKKLNIVLPKEQNPKIPAHKAKQAASNGKLCWESSIRRSTSADSLPGMGI